jgi:hypothetical protein
MVRAVAFDSGGVLELTPPTGWQPRWGSQLGLSEEQFRTLLADAGHAGSLATSTSSSAPRPRRDCSATTSRRSPSSTTSGTSTSAAPTPNSSATSRAPGAGAHRDPLEQLRRCPRTRAGSLRVRGPLRRDRLLPRDRRHETRPDGVYEVCDLLEIEPREAVFLDDLEVVRGRRRGRRDEGRAVPGQRAGHRRDRGPPRRGHRPRLIVMARATPAYGRSAHA